MDFVKLDVQGAEPLVLESARECLLNHRPDLMMEIAPYDLG